MRIVEIKATPKGAHRNQTINGTLPVIPEGWAVIPDDMSCENFPFGEVFVDDIDGKLTVIEWIAGELPEEEPEAETEPTSKEILDALLGV